MTKTSLASRGGVLTGLWLLTAILTGLPALLLLSFADELAALSAALLLLLAVVVALGAASARWADVHRRLQASLAASVLVMVAAGSALALLSASGRVARPAACCLAGSPLLVEHSPGSSQQ